MTSRTSLASSRHGSASLAGYDLGRRCSAGRAALVLGALGLYLGLSLGGASSAQAQMLSEPGKSSSALGPAAPSDPTAAPAATPRGDDGLSVHSLALRARWVTVPGWSLDAFLDAHTQLNGGWSVGMEYLYRAMGTHLDLVTSLEFAWLNADAGNFLGKGNDPAEKTHYVVFDKLSALSLDASLIGHWNLTSWMEIRVGAGLGVGVVFGNMYQITNNSGCTLQNANDPNNCYPRPVGQIPTYTENTRRILESNACEPDLRDSTKDTVLSPCYRRIDTYPFVGRVVPVLNTLLGFRFRAHRNVLIHLETGWRLVGFYLGAGPEFRF
jgi:hypothetical protein